MTCPFCAHVETLDMPVDACRFFHECVSCAALIRPRAGDCCVFCSFGSSPCPPRQQGEAGCCDPVAAP
ncbi:MAG: GDCCVxC domain-containing (seleno)protein [bacterium]